MSKRRKTTASPNDSWRKRRAAALTMLDEMEALPTMKMQLLANGMTIGVERDSVWAFGRVPTGPVEDAKDDKQKLEAYRPVYAMVDQLAKATPIGAIKRRSVTKSAYRHFQIKRINMNSRWKALDTRAPADRRWHQQRLDEHLYASFAPTMMNDVVLAFGVKLEPKAMGSSWRAAWESTKFTLFEGGVPLVDYERDLEKVRAMFARAGIGELTPKEVRKLDSWWNAGKNPDVPYLPHEDHIHLFRDHRSMRTARQMGPADCSRWSEGLPGHRIISFGTLEELDLNFDDPLNPASNWLLSSMNSGALAVSIRGQVEPPRLTQHALRSNRSAYRNDIRERRAQGKLSRADEEDRLSELTEVEGYYSKGQGSATLMNTSVLAAFDGLVEDFETVDHGAASWLPMENRQSKAWVEMMITSMRRANPYLHDLPAQVIAASGINSVSRVGDEFGVLRGFTEADGLPSRYSVEAAYGSVDRSPLAAVVSGSGGGKSLRSDTPVKTPGQDASIGDLVVGDTVLGRDGEPCRVTGVTPVETKNASYRVTLSDGQVIDADGEHQWVVSTFRDRNYPRSESRRTALENREASLRQAQSLRDLADELGDQHLRPHRIGEIIRDRTDIDRWKSPASVYHAMRMVDVPVAATDYGAGYEVPGFTATHEVKSFDVAEYLTAVLQGFSAPLRRHEEKVAAWQSAVTTVAEHFGQSQTVTARQIIPRLVEAECGLAAMSLTTRIAGIAAESEVAHDGANPPKPRHFAATELFDALHGAPPQPRGHGVQPRLVEAIRGRLDQTREGERANSREIIRRVIARGSLDHDHRSLTGQADAYAKKAGIAPIIEQAEVKNESRSRSRGILQNLYRADEALRGLALRLEQMSQSRMTIDSEERVLSTGEMLAEGVRDAGHHARFAIRVSEPVAGRHLDTDLDPYVLGAWLGDGSSDSGAFANPDAFILDEIEAAGFSVSRGSMDKATDPKNWYMHRIHGIIPLLRAAGVLGNKHIPDDYMRASVSQRMALLAGLMDTDGSIRTSGGCELSLSDQRLARDALELIRSLGIKASMRTSEAGYRDEHGDYVRTKDRHRIKFTTAARVFRLPRKAQRLPESSSLRQTQQWLYITSIEPIEPTEMRCITVDSPDSTYLVAGYVPTHNTTMMQWEAYQTAMLKYPQIVLDFKRKSDLTPLFNRIPGSQTFNLSELGSADGAFDSMLYSESPRDGISMAVDNIRYVDPYSNPAKSSAMEPDLFAALDFAVTQMADRENRVGTLGALRYAHEHGQLADEHMAAIEKISTMPGFTALCGTGESGSLLSKEGVTTLIKIGDGGMKLPSVGSPPTTMVERINVTLVKNVAFAATAALADHKGVLRVDEAWVLTSHVPDDLKELGRVARSQNIDITLYTQEISDALNAGLGNYLTRGMILHIPDASEATAACQLFGLDPTEERIDRITNPGGDASSLDGAGNAGMNYNSLKAIKDPETGAVTRGAVGIDIDVRGRAVPVEIRIPEPLLPIISTNIDDVDARGDGESKPGGGSQDPVPGDEQVVSEHAEAR